MLTVGKGGNGKATLTTYTYTNAQPASSTTAEVETPQPTDIVSRPRSPPQEAARIEKELKKAVSWRVAEDRPWGDMKADKKGEGWRYVEAMVPESIMEDSEGRRKAGRRKKKDEKGLGMGMNGKAVPGAVATLSA